MFCLPENECLRYLVSHENRFFFFSVFVGVFFLHNLYLLFFFSVDFEGCFSRTDDISLKRSRGLSKTQEICHCVSFDLISSYTINHVFVFAALPRRKSTKYLSKHESKVCFPIPQFLVRFLNIITVVTTEIWWRSLKRRMRLTLSVTPR